MSLFFEEDAGDMYDYLPGRFVHGDDVYTPDEYMGEKWWYINGAPDYMISDHERIWSIKSQRFVKPKKMDREGHMGVCLRVNGKDRYFYTHRLMAKAFIPNPNNYPIVRHLNDIPDDNILENFAWGTQHDNLMDAKRNGRTFTADPEVRERIADKFRIPIKAINIYTGEESEYRSQTDAARLLGIQQANIWKVLNKERRHAGGYYFEYLERGEQH